MVIAARRLRIARITSRAFGLCPHPRHGSRYTRSLRRTSAPLPGSAGFLHALAMDLGLCRFSTRTLPRPHLAPRRFACIAGLCIFRVTHITWTFGSLAWFRLHAIQRFALRRLPILYSSSLGSPWTDAGSFASSARADLACGTPSLSLMPRFTHTMPGLQLPSSPRAGLLGWISYMPRYMPRVATHRMVWFRAHGRLSIARHTF